MGTNETMADILREMREEAKFDREDSPDSPYCAFADVLESYADRIEAASERELSRAAEAAASKATLDRTARDAAEYMAYAMAHNSATQGNAAATREALEAIAKFADDGWYDEYTKAGALDHIVDLAKTALSAPPRNCDVYRTVDDAFSACHDDRGYISDPVAERRSTISFMLPIAQETEKIEHSDNAAAMREALEEARRDLWDLMGSSSESARSNMACDMSRKIRAALATPPRNCDVGTADEQADRFKAFCYANRTLDNECSDDCPFRETPAVSYCQAGWSQMPFAPAEGGDNA